MHIRNQGILAIKLSIIIIFSFTNGFDPNLPINDSLLDRNNSFLGPASSTLLQNGFMQSQLFGGRNLDVGKSIILDREGNVIVTGYTDSTDFPTLNGYDGSFNGEYDVFITKFAADGTLIWSTLLGGSGWDQGWDVIADNQNNIIITGYTQSSDFPRIDAYNVTYSDVANAFITKFAADGTLIWSTLLGGSDWDKGWSLCVDSQDNVIITGSTESDDFPTINAYSTTYNGFRDAFVAKFNATGVMLWSTYLGGGKMDSAYSVATDRQDCILLTGSSDSSNFPTVNAFDSTKDRYSDAFVTKIDADGSIVWSTYLGGKEHDDGLAVSVGSEDSVIVTGSTASNDFPMVIPFSNTKNGLLDAFVAKFDANGAIQWSSYHGGNSSEFGVGVIVDQQNNIVVAGTTESSDFPLANAYGSVFHGNEDLFVSMFSSTGVLLWSTYIGGTGYDSLWGLILDVEDNILLTGVTDSIDFPSTTVEKSIDNGKDAFVAILFDPKKSVLKTTSQSPASLSVTLFTLTFLAVAGSLKADYRRRRLKSCDMARLRK